MKALKIPTIDALFDSNLYREVRRIEEAQRTWTQHLQPMDALTEHISKLAEPISVAAQMTSEWQRQEKKWLDSIKAMLDPVADIRKSLMVDVGYEKLIGEIKQFSFLTSEIEWGASQFKGVEKIMRESMQSSLSHAQKMIATNSVACAFDQTMKSFEEVERHWAVPAGLVDSIGALKVMQDKFGKLTLPVLDVASAATLAKLLGPQGLEAQLVALGISPDGTLSEEGVASVEAGIGISRKNLELMTLLGFILAILVPIYQELSSREWQKKTDDQLETQSRLLQTKAKQFESLSRLVEKAIEREAMRTEQRFVVQDRIALVRREPEPGAPVEGKLFPREVVRPISEHGKWIQFEYYHWLLQRYQTGWALKKYFKRVPASYKDVPATGVQLTPNL